MHSPLRLMLPLMVHSGEGASAAEAAPSKIIWAFVGTLAAPRTTVLVFRLRQSQGAMNAPAQRPECVTQSATGFNLRSATGVAGGGLQSGNLMRAGLRPRSRRASGPHHRSLASFGAPNDGLFD